ncbi:MAG TPA: nucleoside hydrolase [Candidatus Methylomirabilis sp.]|jgi:purine nucleosidase/pyrimidine-specific ribonucleoside hydrolase
MALRAIIDTDPGIDDALALILALRSPELRVEAVTTVCGNASVDLTTRNALRVLEIAAPAAPPPVARGADRPLARPLRAAAHVHGEDGLGNLDRCRAPDGAPRYREPRGGPAPIPAHEVLLDAARRAPGEVAVVALGPLTNLALALRVDPAAMRGLRRLVVMGGAAAVPGNVTPAAEFNAWADPEAAQAVLESGLPITLVGLDVTQQVRLLPETIASRFGPRTDPVSRLVCDMAPAILEFAAWAERAPGITLHDPLAVAVASDPTLVRTERLPLRVETRGEHTAGMTVVDRRPGAHPAEGTPLVDVATWVDAERALSLIVDRLSLG